ncbi:hypothetical protein [Burkholderia sp. Bp8963]|uniref:hypothetical protein n=1 Tax=Burkholderia sp. Bp8963 TaxID=2184547 RepID=UPI00163AD855|nr:hypothetical protein [Burkholderia sp. Bp8963]
MEHTDSNLPDSLELPDEARNAASSPIPDIAALARPDAQSMRAMVALAAQAQHLDMGYD